MGFMADDRHDGGERKREVGARAFDTGFFGCLLYTNLSLAVGFFTRHLFHATGFNPEYMAYTSRTIAG